MEALVDLAGVHLDALDGGPAVLDALDLALAPGTLTGLIGPPSSGKSVLLKLIAGLIRPNRGRAIVAGVDLLAGRAADKRQLQRSIGMLFQNNALFDSLTVFENVAFPLRRLPTPPTESEIGTRCKARIEEVGLGHAMDRFPHQLSGGMQKRAGIARATIAEPRLRLFDEPTAGLDPVTGARILALITELHRRDERGVTIIVSNEMDTLLAAVPRVILIDRGKVAWDGASALVDQAPDTVRGFITGEAA